VAHQVNATPTRGSVKGASIHRDGSPGSLILSRQRIFAASLPTFGRKVLEAREVKAKVVDDIVRNIALSMKWTPCVGTLGPACQLDSWPLYIPADQAAICCWYCCGFGNALASSKRRLVSTAVSSNPPLISSREAAISKRLPSAGCGRASLLWNVLHDPPVVILNDSDCLSPDQNWGEGHAKFRVSQRAVAYHIKSICSPKNSRRLFDPR
jgi:hypothetical protein